MAHTYIKNLSVYDFNLTWNPVVLRIAKSGNAITQTLQRWKDTQTVRRLVESGGTEAKRILMLSNLMSKIIKYTHLPCQNAAPFSLGVPGTQERSDVFEKTGGRKLTIFSMELLWTMACYVCLKTVRTWLFRICLQPARPMHGTTVFIARDPPIGEHLLSPNKICF